MQTLTQEARTISFYLEDFFMYCQVERDLAPGTLEKYRPVLAAFTDFLKTNNLSKLDDINKEIIRDFLAGFSKKTTIHGVYAAIGIFRQFGRYLLKHAYSTEGNPFLTLELPKLPKTLPTVVSTKEITSLIGSPFSLLEKMHKGLFRQIFRDWTIMEVLYSTGCRRSELINIKNSDITLDKGYVRVFGKGKKERICFLNKMAIVAIKSYNILKTKEELLPNVPLFITLGSRGMGRKFKPMRQLSLNKLIRKYVSASQLRKDIHPHSFRHAFATHLLENGADIMTIKELLGHVSVDTTQIYTHLSMTKIREDYNKLFGSNNLKPELKKINNDLKHAEGNKNIPNKDIQTLITRAESLKRKIEASKDVSLKDKTANQIVAEAVARNGNKEYISAPHAARILGISVGTLFRYVERGYIKREDNGFSPTFVKEDIENILRSKPAFILKTWQQTGYSKVPDVIYNNDEAYIKTSKAAFMLRLSQLKFSKYARRGLIRTIEKAKGWYFSKTHCEALKADPPDWLKKAWKHAEWTR